MTRDPKSIALAYIEGCGRKDLAAVAPLLAPDVHFAGPNGTIDGVEDYLAVLRRIGVVWVRSDVRKVFADGNDVCVIYDFVTDTPAGAVLAVERRRIEDGRIRFIDLVFDRVTFQPARDEGARRSVPAAGDRATT